jgi:2,4-dienoyl-CoA reductase-like NADH-dependent reductase (Old Yellow Enzyme family)
MVRLFSAFHLRGVTLRNRIVMPPMATYMAGEDGQATDWHLVHYGARAIGGVGLILVEATAVQPEARIAQGALGLWEDAQIEPLARIVRFCQAQGTCVGIQLVHAGRKAWSPNRGIGPGEPVGPSALPFDEGWVTPRALPAEEIGGIVAAFVAAAQRAHAAGFEVLELHAAHGYLLHQFLSPLANRRTDEYGGTLRNRSRLLLEVVQAVRRVWPSDRPLFVRVSATDWHEGGLDVEDLVQVARWLAEEGVDAIDCSSGGIGPWAPEEVWAGYQIPFATRIREATGLPTVAVGLITTPELADEVVRNGRADLVALGRELLRHPQWPLEAAARLGQEIGWPKAYERAKHR